ncbi:hydroxymethylglutaryl-CoA reductase (NADPH) [Alphaproteobacteria bacterium]|nr:hydroxymethylglutaryl-CoA reductase (NADPH) [Alphaproteobacteria bacterium]
MKFPLCSLDTTIPTRIVGSIKIVYDCDAELVSVPMATFETPLWHSTKRGALVSQKTSGIKVAVLGDVMTRSVILEASNLAEAISCANWIKDNEKSIGDAIASSSKFAKLKEMRTEIVGRMIYLRLSVETGNASGHNMSTKAADTVMDRVISNCNGVKYVSVSGNCCVDKKVSAVNGILGRGKRVSAEIFIPRNICEIILNTTPEKIVELNVKKNLVGSILSGGVRSANAHFVNAVLAIYLATGQDAANIVEASQGITFAEITDDDELYFSVNLPNIIVGTVGNGKQLDFAKQNLESMGCFFNDPSSSRRLAAIIASAVLCSELSLMASLTNKGELMDAHLSLERSA